MIVYQYHYKMAASKSKFSNTRPMYVRPISMELAERITARERDCRRSRFHIPFISSPRRAAAPAPPSNQMRSRPASMAAGPTPSAAAASLRPPPPCFDYRAAVLADTRAAAAGNPALAGLIESGALVRVPRRRFGPVPAWRPPDFVEPEDVWILGTSHLSRDSVADVERVLRAVQPDNVVVELCRSRQGHAFP
jgi:hypothetical protein